MLFKIDIYSMGKIFLYDLLKLFFNNKDFSNQCSFVFDLGLFLEYVLDRTRSIPLFWYTNFNAYGYTNDGSIQLSKNKDFNHHMDVYSSDLGHIKGFDKSVFERIYKGINMETFLNHIGNDLEEKLYKNIEIKEIKS